MSLDTVLGAIWSRGVELILGRGLNFTGALRAILNPDTGLIDVDAPFGAFEGTYYVNANFSGTAPDGSQFAPYPSLTEAAAAAVAAGYTSAVFKLRAGVNHVEDFVFPSGGGKWQIEGEGDGVGMRSQVTGTCVCTSVPQSVFVWKNVSWVGAISGQGTRGNGGNFFVMRDSSHSTTVTLTATGAGVGVTWLIDKIGQGTPFFSFGGSSGGVFTAPADSQYFAQNWSLLAMPVLGAGPNALTACRLPAGTLTLLAGTGNSLKQCDAAGAITITAATAAVPCVVDGWTEAAFRNTGVTVNANVAYKVQDASASADRALSTTNITAQAFATSAPRGMYEVEGVLSVITGATAGAAGKLEATYEDMSGAAVTVVLKQPDGSDMSLDLTAAGGKQNGRAVFAHNGDVNVTWNFAGLTTAGPFAGNAMISLRRLN